MFNVAEPLNKILEFFISDFFTEEVQGGIDVMTDAALDINRHIVGSVLGDGSASMDFSEATELVNMIDQAMNDVANHFIHVDTLVDDGHPTDGIVKLIEFLPHETQETIDAAVSLVVSRYDEFTQHLFNSLLDDGVITGIGLGGELWIMSDIMIRTVADFVSIFF